jgi:hypothetical protein
MDAYFSGSVAPLLDASAQRDREAGNIALKRLHEHFAQFHAGVPAFAEDITKWGTRFGVVGRSVKDLWTKFWEDAEHATATSNYVNEKFRTHIVSEEKLQRAIEDTLAVFRETVAANRNRTLAEVQYALTMPECPVRLPPLKIEALFANAGTSAGRLATTHGKDSVVNGVAGFAGGSLAGEAATRLVAALFARLAASTAATIVAEGSATAGATAAGGATGTVAGPAGTIVGAGVGIVVGVITDWWMTDSFKAKLHDQCGAFLTGLERDIIHGKDATPGLRKTLEASAAEAQRTFSDALQRAITTPQP